MKTFFTWLRWRCRQLACLTKAQPPLSQQPLIPRPATPLRPRLAHKPAAARPRPQRRFRPTLFRTSRRRGTRNCTSRTASRAATSSCWARTTPAGERRPAARATVDGSSDNGAAGSGQYGAAGARAARVQLCWLRFVVPASCPPHSQPADTSRTHTTSDTPAPPSRDAAKGALGAWPGGLQLGGGVTSDNAAEWLDAGASHVIVTSYVFREGRLEEDRLRDLVRRPGRGCSARQQRAHERRMLAHCHWHHCRHVMMARRRTPLIPPFVLGPRLRRAGVARRQAAPGAGPQLPQEGGHLLRSNRPLAALLHARAVRGDARGAGGQLRRVPGARRRRGGHAAGD